MKCPESNMAASSSEQLSDPRNQHDLNNDLPPGEDAYSLTSSRSRLRTVKVTKPGVLLLLSLILVGCGIAMILSGITLWSQDSDGKGVTIAGVLLFAIGLGIASGAWYTRKQAKYRREHRMPVVTISLSQNFQGENSVLEGEFNSAIDVPSGSEQTRMGQHSNITYYDYSDGDISPRVQGTVVNIQIHSTSTTPSNRVSKSHSKRTLNSGTFPSTRQHPQMRTSTPSPPNNDGSQRFSSHRERSKFSDSDALTNDDPHKLYLRGKQDSKSSQRLPNSSPVMMDHNENVCTDRSDIPPSISFAQEDDSPPPSYFESIGEDLDPSVV